MKSAKLKSRPCPLIALPSGSRSETASVQSNAKVITIPMVSDIPSRAIIRTFACQVYVRCRACPQTKVLSVASGIRDDRHIDFRLSRRRHDGQECRRWCESLVGLDQITEPSGLSACRRSIWPPGPPCGLSTLLRSTQISSLALIATRMFAFFLFTAVLGVRPQRRRCRPP